VVNDFALSPHFRLREFQDPETQEVKVYPELVERLEQLRALVGKPITITRGYSTAATNLRVGGAVDSQHRLGKAADVFWEGMVLDETAALAERAGFNGIGINRTKVHLHVDVRIKPARWEE